MMYLLHKRVLDLQKYHKKTCIQKKISANELYLTQMHVSKHTILKLEKPWVSLKDNDSLIDLVENVNNKTGLCELYEIKKLCYFYGRYI